MSLNRRDFLKKAALVAAGIVAADQLDLLERLTWKRKFFPGFGGEYPFYTYDLGFSVSRELLDDDIYRLDEDAKSQWISHMKKHTDSYIVDANTRLWVLLQNPHIISS